MAQFYTQAAGQMNPGFNQQIKAQNSQIPAIQQLYQTLIQGLQGQQQAGQLSNLEASSGRGVLKSTIPVDANNALGQQIVQQAGQFAAQQGNDISGIYGNVANLRTQQAQGTSQLANQYQQSDLRQQQFNYNQQQAERQYQLALQSARRS